MRTTRRTLALAGAGLAALVGCGGAGQSGEPDGGYTFQSTPLMSLQSSSGQLTIQVFTAPDQPPVRGEGAARLVITDSSGAPVEGLQISMEPWMPAMGHGTGVTPVVAAQGHGQYEATNLDLVMPGTWELRTTITGAVSDSADPSFEVE